MTYVAYRHEKVTIAPRGHTV